MKDHAYWYDYGIGDRKINDLATGCWEFYLGDSHLNYREAQYHLLNQGFSYKESLAYLQLLIQPWL